MQKTTNYVRSERGDALANDALSFAIVWFRDKNKKKFYSRDRFTAKSNPDQSLGLARLQKMINKFSATHIEQAIIYDNTSKEEMYRFKDGIWSDGKN